jgi:tetratricopeptide (TPR) repeat protein
MNAAVTKPPASGPLPRPERLNQPPRGRRRWVRIGLGCLTAAIVLAALAGFVTRFDPMGRAEADFNRHRYSAALRAAQDHLRWFPRDRRAAMMAARCLSRLGRAAEAEDHYRMAGPLDVEDAQVRALGLLSVDQPVRAAEVYEEILARRPDDALAMRRLAAVRMGMKQWRPVLELADRLIRLPGEEVAGRTLAAIAHHELKHYELSVEAAGRVLELDPKLKSMPLPRSLFWKNLALDLMAQGRDAEARGYLEHALADTEDASLMELLGVTYWQQGATEQAERCWRQAERWDPNNADVCLDLGRLAMGRQRWREALDFFERAARLSPESVEPLYSLSQVHGMLGKPEAAARYRRMADERRKAQPARRGGMGGDTEPDDPMERRATAGSEPER